MAEEPGGRTPGFEIKGRFYDWPTPPFRVCDWVLLRDVTGLESSEFAERHDAMLEDSVQPEMIDMVMFSGLIAVAIWQKFPDWKRTSVVQYVEKLGEGDVKMVGMEPDGPPEATPPLPDQSETAWPSSSETSNGTPESLSEPLSPSRIGMPDSAVGARV